tara:strand:+ start:570 stop:797 length:228 start_codon:yes stop_codon:yes gene_type:complete
MRFEINAKVKVLGREEEIEFNDRKQDIILHNFTGQVKMEDNSLVFVSMTNIIYDSDEGSCGKFEHSRYIYFDKIS